MNARRGATFGTRAKRYLSSRWNGDAPLALLFWRDMLLIGSIVNAATTLAALWLLANDAPTVVAFVMFVSPLPWNIFLFVSVWRSAARVKGSFAFAAQLAAVVWVIAASTL